MDNDARGALQSVMREQEIKASKGTATQTIPARTSVLVSSRPQHGRFDKFALISEQLDLSPDLISQFDLIFPVPDIPEAEIDQKEAEYILTTHHAGEVNAHQEQAETVDISEEAVESLMGEVAPEIESGFLREYIAYARRHYYPSLTEDAKSVIEEFYVDLRSVAEDQDSPIPVSARKIAAIVRLAEASARARLSDTIEEEDAQRAVDIVDYSLKQIGVNPDVDDLDAEDVDKEISKTQREPTRSIHRIIEELEPEYDGGVPFDIVFERAKEVGISKSKTKHDIEKLKQKGDVYEPRVDVLLTT